MPLHRPVLGDEEARAVADVLASGYLVAGPRVAAFEAGVAERVGLAHAMACSSGTAALHLALRALNVGPGDEVLVPAFGFPATGNVVELCGARAIAADVDPDTFAVTAETLAAAATPRTVGAIPVHPFGIPAPMAELNAWAAQTGCWLVEDAACSLGTTLDGRWATGEHLVCLSFHPRKTITTGEGGMVLCADADLAARVRQLRNHGMATDGRSGWRRFEEAGFNYRMTDLAAAIGVVQLGRLDDIVAARQRVCAWYVEALAGVGGVDVPGGYAMGGLSFQSFVVVLSGEVARDDVIAALAAQGIQSTIGGYCLVEQPYYERRYAPAADAAPISRMLGACSLTLPVSHEMTRAEVEAVVSALAGALGS